MKEGKASEAKSGNKGLVILLCVLAVVIVGLGVGVIVANRNNKGTDANTGVELGSGFVVTDGPVDADYVLDLIRSAESLNSVEEGIGLYESAIAMNAENIEDILRLRISYCDFLLNNGLTEACFKQLDLIDKTKLDVMQLIRLYIAYRNDYIYIEDEEMAARYDAEVERLVEENNISDNAEF